MLRVAKSPDAHRIVGNGKSKGAVNCTVRVAGNPDEQFLARLQFNVCVAGVQALETVPCDATITVSIVAAGAAVHGLITVYDPAAERVALAAADFITRAARDAWWAGKGRTVARCTLTQCWELVGA